jgi:polyisoprenoid-binding protein YceI
LGLLTLSEYARKGGRSIGISTHMKKAVALVAVLTLAVVTRASAAPSTSVWTVDPVHSSATFTATHLGISHVSGTIPIVSATLSVPANGTIPTEAQAQLNLSGIDTHNDMRDSDLRSAHFFDVADFPKMAFASTSITAVDATHFTIAGNLTMHGVTHPVTLNAQFIGKGPGMRPGEQRIGYVADGTISRSQWGMTGFVPVVSDAIDIHLEIEAYQN